MGTVNLIWLKRLAWDAVVEPSRTHCSITAYINICNKLRVWRWNRRTPDHPPDRRVRIHRNRGWDLNAGQASGSLYPFRLQCTLRISCAAQDAAHQDSADGYAMKIYLKTVTVCAILMGSVLSSAAYAQCALKPEWIEAATRLPSIQIPAAIPVDSNTPVGRVIWRTPVPAPNPQFITNINIGCNGTMSATGLNNGVPGEPLEPNQVYRTNVDGVGYRILNSRHRFPFQITRNLGSWRWPNTVEMEDLAFELV